MKKKLSIEIGLSQGLLVPSLSALCTYDIVCPFGRAWYLKRWHFVFGSHTEKCGQARDSRVSTLDTDKPYVFCANSHGHVEIRVHRIVMCKVNRLRLLIWYGKLVTKEKCFVGCLSMWDTLVFL